MEYGRQNNIGWVDLLRVLACFMVVFSHSCDAFVAQFDADRASFLTGVFGGSLMRASVPLFVMMTGVLLLPVGQGYDLVSFYRKRIGRILPPLVFWSVALPLLMYAYFNYINPSTCNPQVAVGGYTVQQLVQRIYTFVFNFNFDTTPLWYLYMLIGLYLLMPVLNAWLVQASQRELKVVLGLWVVSLFLPYLKMLAPVLGYQGNYGNMELLGMCDWNIYGTFYYFSGFVGYLVLAYYLKQYPLQWSWSKMLAIMIPLFVAGYAITAGGYILTQEHFPGNYAYLEIVWYFNGINVFMMTLSLFAIVQKMAVRSRRWLSRLASLAFGIYLCHFVFVFVCYDLYDMAMLPYWVRIPCIAVTTFAIATLVAWLMSRAAFTARFVR
ncbi:MAG TPA: acyltransferase family protein [Candidatus Avimuribaculum pullicola]|nr:acyltransferase family protein [Candidatus Avimuribaculum pullicola]